MITSEHKLTYLKRQKARMQKAVDEMPDSNQDKSRCQFDVDIVAELISALEPKVP